MKLRSGASDPQRLPTIGIGTGINERLVDPGAARALSFAAEELGYSSVWTFDSPAGQRWNDPHLGRQVAEVLTTLETFVAATSAITVGAALLRASWPLHDTIVKRLVAAQQISRDRVAIARPWSPMVDTASIGPTLQMWSPTNTELAPWARGWMFEKWEHELPWLQTLDQREGVVVRLPVKSPTDGLVAEIRRLATIGASEIVLDVVTDEGIDHALAVYSRIAEAVEADLARHTA